jgi:hypothetical protein
VHQVQPARQVKAVQPSASGAAAPAKTRLPLKQARAAH